MADRIKGLRQKESTGLFTDFIPFGTDGILVDMLSGLDNEQEIKLGGNHTAAITETINKDNEPVTTITESYKDRTGTVVQYTVVNEIIEHEDGSTTITGAIYHGSDITTEALNIKTITIPTMVDSSITIEEELT